MYIFTETIEEADEIESMKMQTKDNSKKTTGICALSEGEEGKGEGEGEGGISESKRGVRTLEGEEGALVEETEGEGEEETIEEVARSPGTPISKQVRRSFVKMMSKVPSFGLFPSVQAPGEENNVSNQKKAKLGI